MLLLTATPWTPPGIGGDAWRRALAEDMSDLLASLAAADVALVASAADGALADAVRWPGTTVYAVDPVRPVAALAAAAAAGYDEAAVVAPDVPDLPAMLVGKLLQPLASGRVAVAPVLPSGRGLVGLGTRLPVPEWLVAADPDLDTATSASLRDAASRGQGRVSERPGWHRLRDAAALGRLDVAVEGWEATRALLGARHT